MNTTNLTYTIIITNNSIKKEVEISFTNNSKGELSFNGTHHFYISEKPEDNNNLNFFDFCAGISNDINFLKKISLQSSNELDYFFGEKNININDEYKKEEKRLESLQLIQESDYEKASILIDNYFKIFNKDRIEKNDWDNFVKYFDLNKKIPIVKNVIEIEKESIEHDGDKNYLYFLKNNNIGIDLKQYRKKLNNSDLKAQKNYECHNSKELFAIIISALFDTYPNKVIKKCKLCGKLFIPYRSDTYCCTRKVLGYSGKNCRDVYEIVSKLERNKEDDCIALRKKIYDKSLNKILTAKSDEYEKNERMFLDKFMRTAANIRKKIKTGEKDRNDYLIWLTAVDETGVIPND